MNFGLGLVLSFTDNATAGINNAVNSLNQLTSVAEGATSSLNQMVTLSALSVVADQMGSAFLDAGNTILSTLGQITSEVISTGQTLYYAENQLNALYRNSGKTGSEVIAQIQEYAKTSMFEFENLIPAVTSLKSVGIEAFDSITSSMGNSKNNLLDYASALASFAPHMKNAYGKGINAAIGAMREYIAEGNALSLKRGAGLDITGILGEDKGATIEERTRQVADLIETLGMLEMVDIMKTSPMTMLSNMSDVLFQLKGMISDSGVYSEFTELIAKLSNYVMEIPEEELQSIANVIGSALTTIMTPLEWVADKVLALADGLRNLVANNPTLVKLMTIGVAIGGVLLVLVGIFLKVTSALSGLSLLLLTFGKSFGSIGGIMKAGFLKITSVLIPLIAMIGLLSLAWKNDFAGIRTNLSYFVSNLSNSFKTARQAVDGSVSELTSTLEELRNKDDFFSNLTLGIMKVMMVFKALADAWSDNTLSEENFLKAKELGVLPLIEAILDLKYRFENFMKGFLDGWSEIGEKIENVVMGILDNIDGTFLEPLIDGITRFLQALTSGDAQAWYDFGNSFAKFTALIAGFVLGFKAISAVVGIVTKVIGFFTKLWSVIKTVATIISTVVGKIGSILTVIGTFVTAVLGFFGIVVSIPAWLVGAITVAVVALIALIVAKWEEISAFLGRIGSWIYNNVILPVVDFFKGLWNDIVNIFYSVGEWFTEKFQQAKTGIENAWSSIGSFFSGIWTKITTVFSNVGTWFGEKFRSAVEKIKSFFNPLVTFFKGVWDKITNLFKSVGTTVGDAISGAVKGAINKVLSGAVRIINGFISAINFAVDVINAIPGVSISKLSKLSVPALAQGGVIDKPTTALIGEAGTEAVVPLENNTEWLGKLARMIVTEVSSIRPANTLTQTNNTNQGDSNNQRYLTTNNNSNQTIHGDTDNSIVFNAGAIQVTVQNATEEEAIRLAKKVMEYIKRQRELDQMLNYA